MEIALYRIAQEALQNVVKHSGAASADVELRCDATRALLRVSDDGRGFDVGARADDSASSSYGLRSMAERAELIGGRLAVTSRPGVGTTVTATVPLARAAETSRY
jgi:signal transduction histidine kinase